MPEHDPLAAHEKLVIVASFSTAAEAGLAKSRLVDEGITAFLDNENLIAVDWLLSNATGGVKVTVPTSQAARAREILQSRPDLDEADRDEDDGYADEPYRCPKCHLKELSFVPFSGLAVLASLLFVGLPLLFLSRAKQCRACGHQWK